MSSASGMSQMMEAQPKPKLCSPQNTEKNIFIKYMLAEQQLIWAFKKLCDKCESRKTPPHRNKGHLQTYLTGMPFERISTYSFERISTDLLGPLPVTARRNKYILLIGDHFTKWIEGYALPNQEVETVAK
jgi:hypothetical protein